MSARRVCHASLSTQPRRRQRDGEAVVDLAAQANHASAGKLGGALRRALAVARGDGWPAPFAGVQDPALLAGVDVEVGRFPRLYGRGQLDSL